MSAPGRKAGAATTHQSSVPGQAPSPPPLSSLVWTESECMCSSCPLTTSVPQQQTSASGLALRRTERSECTQPSPAETRPGLACRALVVQGQGVGWSAECRAWQGSVVSRLWRSVSLLCPPRPTGQQGEHSRPGPSAAEPSLLRPVPRLHPGSESPLEESSIERQAGLCTGPHSELGTQTGSKQPGPGEQVPPPLLGGWPGRWPRAC